MSSPGPEGGPTRTRTHPVPGLHRAGTSDRPIPEPAPVDLPVPGEAGHGADGSGADAYFTELADHYRVAERPVSAAPAGPLGADWPGADQPGADWPGADQAGADQPGADRDSAGPAPDSPAGSPADDEAGVASPSLVRSSGVMALGTLASRVTGLLRNVVLVYAIGVTALGDSYNYANTLPNTVYNLAIGGILTSVIVPLLVSAAKRDSDRGEKYDQRMFTLVTIVLLVITLGATLAAAPIAHLYDPKATGNAHHVLVIFAYFFIPQIFFYGISSLAGAILNARGHFAAPMWTPVVNNIVVLIVAVAFMAIAGTSATVDNITPLEVQLLGIGTTLGIVAQTAALIPALRRVGFRWRPRFDFRRTDVAEIGRMAGWMFGYVVTTQVAFLVTSIVASYANNSARGFAAYSNAWLLFQLPYAIVGISVITALLPRMSAHAADRKFHLVQADFSTGVRLGSVIVAPSALVLAVLGPSLAEVLLGWGETTGADARYLGLVFSVFTLGLVPYMMFQLLLRVFYSLHDSRTPALIGVVTMATNIGANLIALTLFPPSQLVAALGIGFGLANSIGSVIGWIVLSRRLGGLAGHEIGSSLLRMNLAAVPAALFALAVTVMISGVFSTGKVAAAAVVILGGGGALLFYVMFAKAARVTELSDLTGMVRSRLGR
jgi:putative peptidoglycan lipid II flippase